MKTLIAVILYCLIALPARGAFGSKTQWYVDGSGGSDNNGGGFDSGVGSPGTDESGTATAITITLTGTTTGTCAPACSATTHGPGNIIRIASGTGCTLATNYEIISQSAGTITVDKAMGSNTNVCVGVIGGPFATINAATAKTVTANTVNVKDSATYSISAALTAPASGAAGTPTIMRGYHSTVGDAGNCTISPTGIGCPVVQATAGVFTMLTFSNIDMAIKNFVFDCNSQTTSTGLSLNSNSASAFNMTIKNCAATGLVAAVSGGESASHIWVHGGTSGCSQGVQVANNGGGTFVSVVSESNLCTGFNIGNQASTFMCVFCVSANNTGASSDGFQINTANTSASGVWIVSSAAYKNGRDAFRITSVNGSPEVNVRYSYAYGNSGKSFNSSAGALLGTQQFNWNAYESGTLNNILAGPNDITLTADPTIGGGSGNFALNTTSGGGLLLLGTAFPGSIGSSVGNLSVGPIQPLVNSSTVNVSGSTAFVQ